MLTGTNQTTEQDKLIAQLNQTIECKSITIAESQIIINCTDREQATAAKNNQYLQIVELANQANCGLTSVAFTWHDVILKRWILPL